VSELGETQTPNACTVDDFVVVIMQSSINRKAASAEDDGGGADIDDGTTRSDVWNGSKYIHSQQLIYYIVLEQRELNVFE
jgi:hypothetical protein